MTVAELPAIAQKALFTYEALRRLGFLPEDLFFVVARPLQVQLRTQGVVFTIDIGDPGPDFEEPMRMAIRTWNDCARREDPDAVALYHAFLNHFNSVRFITAIMEKGIILPKMLEQTLVAKA